VKSIYISGGMSSYPQSNFHAFDYARDLLVFEGWFVFSPADHDRELGFDPTNGSIQETGWTPEMMAAAADWDLTVIQHADAIYMLEGWELSKGARAEHAVAVWLGKQIFYESAM
jgi:hypothetical protein